MYYIITAVNISVHFIFLIFCSTLNILITMNYFRLHIKLNDGRKNVLTLKYCDK